MLRHTSGNTMVPGAVALALLTCSFASASDVEHTGCEMEEPQLSTQLAAADTLRALFVFARFPDGEDVRSDGTTAPPCENCGPGWSATDVYAPVWADSLLEDTTSPQKPGSLTHLFHTMSGGKHVLKGWVLEGLGGEDTVVVSDQKIVDWLTQYPDREEATFQANRRLLEQQVDPLVNFAEFDSSGPGGAPDGVVDYIFILWHSPRNYDDATRTFRDRVNAIRR